MTLPRVGADIELDLSSYDRQIRQIIAGARDAESAVDRLQNQLAGLSGGGGAFNITVNDGELRQAVGMADELDGSVSLAVNVDDSELSGITDNIDDARNNPIQLTFDVGQLPGVLGAVLGAVQSGLNFAVEFSGIGGLLEMDSIMARLSATTSEMIPNADELINNIFVAGWGETRGEIAGVLALAQQYGIELEDLETATQNALMLSELTGEDPAQLLRTMVNLVRTELVPGFTEAGDVIITGFQNGLNIGDDFLDTLNEYGTSFSALGMDAESAMNFLNAGLTAGIDNTDRIADSFRELRLRVMENPEAVQEALEALDMEGFAEQFRQGEISGESFINGLTEALEGVEDPAERSRLAVELFGTQFEDFDPAAFNNALATMNNQLSVTDGALNDAGTAISETLPGAIDRARRILSTGIGEFLDEQLNITGLVDDLGNDIQRFFDSMQSGDDFTTAFRVAFDDNQIVDVLVTIREILSDIFFALGSGLSDALSALGVDTTGLNSGLQSLALAELQIDVATIRDPEDMTNAVAEAIGRGVDVETVMDALNETWATALETNDVELLQASAEGMMQALSATSFSPEEIEAMGGEEVAAQFIANSMENVQEALGNATNTIAGNLVESLNQALAEGDLVGALNIDEQLAMTGNTLLSGGTMQSAQFDTLLAESGLTFDELTEMANDGMASVTQYVDEGAVAMSDSLETTATDWQTSLSGMDTDLTLFRESAIEDFDLIQTSANLSIEGVRGGLALLSADLSAINTSIELLSLNIGSLPTGLGNGGTVNYTNNQTNYNTSQAQSGNANAQTATAASVTYP